MSNVIYANRAIFFLFFVQLNATVFYTSPLNHRNNNTKMTNYKNNTLSFLVPSRIDTMVWQHVHWLNHDHLGMEIRCFPKGSRFCSLRRDVCISVCARNKPFLSIIYGCIPPSRARPHDNLEAADPLLVALNAARRYKRYMIIIDLNAFVSPLPPLM